MSDDEKIIDDEMKALNHAVITEHLQNMEASIVTPAMITSLKNSKLTVEQAGNMVLSGWSTAMAISLKVFWPELSEYFKAITIKLAKEAMSEGRLDA